MKRVLVIDDEFGIRHIIRLALSQAHIEVTEAGTAHDGLAVHFKPDLILLDLRLPDMHGASLAQELKRRWACPILLISASSEVVQQAQSEAIDGYLEKPFKLDRLVSLVEEWLTRTAEVSP